VGKLPLTTALVADNSLTATPDSRSLFYIDTGNVGTAHSQLIAGRISGVALLFQSPCPFGLHPFSKGSKSMAANTVFKLNRQGSHKFKKKDTIDKIGKEWGFPNGKPIWDDPMNKTLKAKRKSAEALQEGDVILIPFTPQQKLDITNKKLHYLDLITGERALCTLFEERARLSKDAGKRALDQINALQKTRDDLARDLYAIEKGIKDTKQVVDTVNDVLNVLAKIGSIGAKAAKASGEELTKLNKEAMKEITGIPANKAKDAAKEAVIDYSLSQHHPVALMEGQMMLMFDCFAKMTSPGFWAQTTARMLTSGKGFTWANWADASTFDYAQEVTNTLHMADRQFIPAKMKATRVALDAFKIAEEHTKSARYATERAKI
jgi:hypothetical protein